MPGRLSAPVVASSAFRAAERGGPPVAPYLYDTSVPRGDRHRYVASAWRP